MGLLEVSSGHLHVHGQVVVASGKQSGQCGFSDALTPVLAKSRRTRLSDQTACRAVPSGYSKRPEVRVDCHRNAGVLGRVHYGFAKTLRLVEGVGQCVAGVAGT